MKRWMLLLCLPAVLLGCGREETFETVADEPALAVMASPRQISVELPEDAVAPVLEQEGQQLYLCSDYEILLETLPAGDLGKTVRQISGYDRENLTVMETRRQELKRYDFVWAAAGEQGTRLGRAVILDDGQYHYCMSLLRDAEGEDSQIVWDRVFGSFCLA